MTATAPATRGRRPRDPAPRRGSRSAGCVRARRRCCVLAGRCSAWRSAAGPSRCPTVIDVLFHPDGSEASTIVHELRLPRTVLALAVGVALGIAGALMQGHTRNPLAEPGLLGVSAGAAFAVVHRHLRLRRHRPRPATPGSRWPAPASPRSRCSRSARPAAGPNPVSLVLAGAAVTALLAALTQAIVLRDLDTLDEYRFWVVGSASGRGMDVFWQVLPFLVVGLLLAAISARASTCSSSATTWPPRSACTRCGTR